MFIRLVWEVQPVVGDLLAIGAFDVQAEGKQQQHGEQDAEAAKLGPHPRSNAAAGRGKWTTVSRSSATEHGRDSRDERR